MKRTLLLAMFCLLALELVGGGGASAAVPPASIHPTSCGGTAVPNSNCSFSGSGAGVVIGANSCKVADLQGSWRWRQDWRQLLQRRGWCLRLARRQ